MPNRLIHETSPYLLQHAHNPVDWYPWGSEALAKARQENKIILVSIGYSACHWCHVMERESFENEETAAIMNRNFVNIKIDREERPDLDQVYMDAVQTISGSGGWPLNVFLTPDAKPFYGGTYFPPVRAYNRSSWREVLSALHSAWIEKPHELISQAENLTEHLSKAAMFGRQAGDESPFSDTDIMVITQNLLKNADTQWGGFGKAPKFPQTFCIQFLLRQFYFNQKKAGQNPFSLPDNLAAIHQSPLAKQALISIDKMIMGGIYDQLQGGFARYSTDAEWLAPHFEKMLYDNALLIGIISEAYQITKKDIYKRTIGQTMHFIASEWQDDDGGFFSAYDADSEGVEGKYYTWQLSELEALIPDKQQLQLFVDYYGVEEEGNWEHTNILWVRWPLEEFCLERGIDIQTATATLQDCRNQLLAHRNSRVKPLLDDKKLLSWNALMITACCKAWCALGNDEYLKMAEKGAVFIETCLKSGDSYHHNYKDNKSANPAFLEDLACYVQALCHLQECTGNVSWLEIARTVTTNVLADFSDTESPFFFYTPAIQEDIIFRKKDMYDGATPSGNSMMAVNLYYLGALLDNQEWKNRAIEMVRQVKSLTVTYPSSFSIWAQLMQWLVYEIKEVAVIGTDGSIATQILRHFIPDKLLQQSNQGNGEYPLLKGKRLDKNNTTVYVCSNYSCKRPVINVTEALELLN